MRRMGKKPDKDRKPLFCFRADKAELNRFREQAEAEGFGSNVSAWLLWHLRKVIREADEKKP